jgi:hypothetical protein
MSNKFNFASDERIAFCFKLWVKELMEMEEKSDLQQTIIDYALNEILDGDYCSDEEFERKEQFISQLKNLITENMEGNA